MGGQRNDAGDPESRRTLPPIAFVPPAPPPCPPPKIPCNCIVSHTTVQSVCRKIIKGIEWNIMYCTVLKTFGHKIETSEVGTKFWVCVEVFPKIMQFWEEVCIASVSTWWGAYSKLCLSQVIRTTNKKVSRLVSYQGHSQRYFCACHQFFYSLHCQIIPKYLGQKISTLNQVHMK